MGSEIQKALTSVKRNYLETYNQNPKPLRWYRRPRTSLPQSLAPRERWANDAHWCF